MRHAGVGYGYDNECCASLGGVALEGGVKGGGVGVFWLDTLKISLLVSPSSSTLVLKVCLYQ